MAGAEGVGKESAGDEAKLQGARGDTALENHGLLFRTKWEGVATLSQRVTRSDSCYWRSTGVQGWGTRGGQQKSQEAVAAVQGREDGGLARVVAVAVVRNIWTSDVF